jgi:hypothetical protein
MSKARMKYLSSRQNAMLRTTRGHLLPWDSHKTARMFCDTHLELLFCGGSGLPSLYKVGSERCIVIVIQTA